MRSRTVLLVEDNPGNVELTIRAFGREHITNEVVVVGFHQFAGAVKRLGLHPLIINEPPPCARTL